MCCCSPELRLLCCVSSGAQDEHAVPPQHLPAPRESSRAPTPLHSTPPRPAPQNEPRVRALWVMMETIEMAQKTALLAKEKSVDDACGTRHCGRNEMWLECIVV